MIYINFAINQDTIVSQFVPRYMIWNALSNFYTSFVGM